MQSLAHLDPIFEIKKLDLHFSTSAEFVAAQVANNVIIIALANNRILRIDLDNASDIDDIDLPKKTAEIGLIRRLFLDPTASHLIISTVSGENYYLHTQSRQPKALSRLKGVTVESIGWNPALPTASTREILVGAIDGNVYEDYVEPSNEFYRSQEKYIKLVYKASEGPIVGIYIDSLPDKPETKRVLLATPSQILHFAGRVGRSANEGSGSAFTRLFESEAPSLFESARGGKPSPSTFVVSPDSSETDTIYSDVEERYFAWLSSQGVLYGQLKTTTSAGDIGRAVFNNSSMIERSAIPALEGIHGRRKAAKEPISAIALSQWHILCLVEGRIVAIQRLDDQIVYDRPILDPEDAFIGLLADQKKKTFWLFTPQDIFEIIVTGEDREVWRIMLKKQQFNLAAQYAHSPTQKDAVAMASGDYLISTGQYIEAAEIYGKSSQPFEQVALTMIDHGQHDALRYYLLAKINAYSKSYATQRTMIASWLIEIFMSKLNSLDDAITTHVQTTQDDGTIKVRGEMDQVRKEFRNFVARNKSDLDKDTTYEIINSHGHEQELLAYATAIDDHNFVLGYWVQKDRWTEALDVLKKQSDPEIYYKYSSVLMEHAPTEFIDIVTRHEELDPLKFVPAMLNYNNKATHISLDQNQAVRYLNFCINSLRSSDTAIHNTLISVYASHPSPSEMALLSYLSTHSLSEPPPYDADFAFRLCIQHHRVQSAVSIYSGMGDYTSAVNLALKHDEIDLASLVADRPSDENPALRKKLWLEVAKKVIGQQGTGSIKSALDFLKRCELLRIEDLIPFFPDFVVIDDFKEEICAALESYSRSIAALDTEMDASAATAENIKADVQKLDRRYAMVEPGERCRVCELPLMSRQFFVFPSCQHGFHSDCLGRKVMEGSGLTVQRRIRELQSIISEGGRRDKEGRELDSLIGAQCLICGDLAIKSIDKPLVTQAELEADEWAI